MVATRGDYTKKLAIMPVFDDLKREQFSDELATGMIELMKYMLLGLFVFFFVILPMYALNSLVMPGLESLKQTYSNADATAQQLAGTATPTNQP
jgi:hypothetical protein